MNQKEELTQNEELAQEAKYTVKDSVFTDLFKIPKYLLQLYQTLHPEDKEPTEDSISNVTIKNVFLDQPYNDLGFQVGEKLMVLGEAQASWTVNIVIRSFLYLAQTYQEYIETTGQNVYTSKRLKLPRPELYVIYTGERKNKPEFMYLTKEFFGGSECSVEVKVKIIYDGEKGDIINQYVTFTRIYNEQIKQYGRTRKAVLETICICKDQDVLREYLGHREKEVVDIMMTLFDDEYIFRTYVANKEKEAAQKATIAKSKTTAQKLYEKGTSLEDIAEILEMPVEKIKKWLNLASV